MSAVAANSAFAEDILIINSLTKRFGGLVAVDNVDLLFRAGRSRASSARTAPARRPSST